MTKLRLILATMALLTSATLPATAHAEENDSGTVTEIRTYAHGKVLFKIKGKHINPAGCDTKMWYCLGGVPGFDNPDGINRGPSRLTAAYLSGKTVTVDVSATACSYYAIALHVRVI